eukprot:TRINITY_DN13028_c0_g1_i6.p1 TRINITY_DN13028_c0_g1~~TRINITY_DN13028_c0_g1_i6.p1  ORF type:complete len:203 (-),score=73.76 TRINITY_DN13028_c0_g1_i6:145-753(-)
MQNYWKQKDVFQKHQIQSNMSNSKQMLSKLTGLPLPNTGKVQTIEDEDALLESLNNLDYLLVQQKMPAKEKQDARIKLAEHMGVLPRNRPLREEVQSVGSRAKAEKMELAGEQKEKRLKGIRGRIDEIKSQRSETSETKAKKDNKLLGVKYGDMNRAKQFTEAQSEHVAQEINEPEEEFVPRENKKERVIVSSKFNIKDLLA